MAVSDLLLDRLEEELGDLRGPQLVPSQGSLASLLNQKADGVGGGVDWDEVWEPSQRGINGKVSRCRQVAW